MSHEKTIESALDLCAITSTFPAFSGLKINGGNKNEK
jgi:hypothetical protein